MRVFPQIYNCQQKTKQNKKENRMMCGERGNSEKILSSRWEKKQTKQNKKQKQKGRAPLLGLAKSIYYQ